MISLFLILLLLIVCYSSQLQPGSFKGWAPKPSTGTSRSASHHLPSSISHLKNYCYGQFIKKLFICLPVLEQKGEEWCTLHAKSVRAEVCKQAGCNVCCGGYWAGVKRGAWVMRCIRGPLSASQTPLQGNKSSRDLLSGKKSWRFSQLSNKELQGSCRGRKAFLDFGGRRCPAFAGIEPRASRGLQVTSSFCQPGGARGSAAAPSWLSGVSQPRITTLIIKGGLLRRGLLFLLHLFFSRDSISWGAC